MRARTWIAGVTTVKVLDVVPHPDADRLLLVDIEHAGGLIRVVCGARNYAPAQNPVEFRDSRRDARRLDTRDFSERNR